MLALESRVGWIVAGASLVLGTMGFGICWMAFEAGSSGVGSPWAWASAAAVSVLAFGAASNFALGAHLRASRDFNKEAVEAQVAMIEALGAAIAKRDSDTGAHNFRVAWISARLGMAVGISGRRLQALVAGSFLHDVGKIGVPDSVLLKPGKLDENESKAMREHVRLGEQIIERIGWLREASGVVSAHHERWDGSGYPRALKAEAIPVLARVFAIADVFDALRSRRPYKEPLGLGEALEAMRADSGSHFDPRLFEAFEKIAAKVDEELGDGSEQRAKDLIGELLRSQFGLSGLG